jgi:hypothetical protein
MGAMGDRRIESSAARTDVVRNLRMAVKRFDLSGDSRDQETWDFLCECGAGDCRQWVTLPVSEYELLRAAGEPILAPGHAVVQTRASRRNARRLVSEAKALRGQAELQLRRALRNLRKP